MKAKYTFLVLVVLMTSIYGIYAIVELLFNNRTPFTITCTGLKLDKTKVYAISNKDRVSHDTLFIHFQQSKSIMPSTLGFLYFDKSRGEFVLNNNNCIYKPVVGKKAGNAFLPYCRSQEKEIYFDGEAIIGQDFLLEQGVKYNSAVGDKQTRVSIKLFKCDKDVFLQTKDDGLLTSYGIISDRKNNFEVLFNCFSASSNCPYIFSFDNTSSLKGKYEVSVTPIGLFDVEYIVKDINTNTILVNGNGTESEFNIQDFHFEIKPKYSNGFALIYIFSISIILLFQVFLLRELKQYESPILISLISIRILFNSLSILAIPLFLIAFTITKGREWYVLFLICLNITYFLPKDILIKPSIKQKFAKVLTSVIWIVILIAPIIFWRFTKNELLFKLIPVLHSVKLIILLLLFVTQKKDFLENKKHKNLIRLGIICSYTFLVSMLTSDTGSFIYTVLALIIIELIRKSITLKTSIVSVVTVVLVFFITFSISPEIVKERKFYRLVAPYITPESSKLEYANESDKESYSTLSLNLKNIVDSNYKGFNNMIIPLEQRSTCFSDYAFHTSLLLGGKCFFLLFILVLFLLLKHLIFLLYISIRTCRVDKDIIFVFPSFRVAELIRFLLALTIIGLIYPVASNLLLIPLTGQSLSILSISNIEVLFLTFIIVVLENVFNDKTHYVKNTSIDYSYSDLKKSITYGLIIICLLFTLAIIFKLITIKDSADTHYWLKVSSENKQFIKEEIPSSNKKSKLVVLSHEIIGDDELTSVEKSKKNLLKTLASLYYTGRPYREAINETRAFNNSTQKLISRMTVDSVFMTKRKLISGEFHPYGDVYSYIQRVNGKGECNVTNKYYKTIPLESQSINADFTAELNQLLEGHLQLIGIPSNIGSIMVVDNSSGNIVANASYPYLSSTNSSEIYYLPGSVKKSVLAYCALVVNPKYINKVFNDKTFKQFLSFSDDLYAAQLLKDILLHHRDKFSKLLKSDFNLQLFSKTEEAFLDDKLPTDKDFNSVLDKNNLIYRLAIGQQRPYRFSDIIQWYSRIASNNKLILNYSNNIKQFDAMSIQTEERVFLTSSLNGVFDGTANQVGETLKNNKIKIRNFICKTGTAQRKLKNGESSLHSNNISNSSSSFIIANEHYTIGIMLNGSLPENNKGMAAKDLFIKSILLMKKYKILIESI